MIERLLPARHRFAVECAGVAVLTVAWLVCLVLGLGGQQTTQAISNVGLIIAASLLLISWVLVLNQVFAAGADNGGHPARRHPGAADIPLPLLGAGLVAWAVADSGFVYLTVVGSYSSGALIDAGDMDRLVGDELTVTRTATGT